MSRGFSLRGADGITHHYNSNGVMIGFSQKGGDSIIRRHNNSGNMIGFSMHRWQEERIQNQGLVLTPGLSLIKAFTEPV